MIWGFLSFAPTALANGLYSLIFIASLPLSLTLHFAIVLRRIFTHTTIMAEFQLTITDLYCLILEETVKLAYAPYRKDLTFSLEISDGLEKLIE